MKFTIIAALAFTAWTAVPASANGMQCYPGGPFVSDASKCDAPQPQPDPGSVGVGVGVGTGIGIGTGGAGGNGGAGGSATGGQGGSGGNATGGTSFGSTQGQAQSARTGDISIRNRAAASSAIAAPLPGYGPANCFGDTNPSGSFSAAFGNIFAGASASSQKASNICAVAALGGPALAIGYLQRMDPNMPRSVTVMQPTGRVACPPSHPVYVEGRGCRK